jgi:Uncharacterised protein family UPF0047
MHRRELAPRTNARGFFELTNDIAAVVRSIVVPVADGRLQLGTWQGIYLWEHRTSPHERRLIVTVW